MNRKIAFSAGLGLALAFTSSCFPESGGSKNDCIRTELGVKANTLDDVAAACDAKRGEILSQISDKVGSCSKNDLDFDKPIKDIVVSCGVAEIPVISGISSSSRRSSSSENSSGSCDMGDYETVKIGEQLWMAENLNCYVAGSKCYGDDPANCDKYGRLYNWARAREVCPAGWHLPTNEDWDKLYRYADGTSGTESPYYSETAGKHLKANSGWGSGGNGTDEFRFAALPGGYGNSDGSFGDVGEVGRWWSSSEYNVNYAYFRLMYQNDDAYWYGDDKSWLLSVRCLRN